MAAPSISDLIKEIEVDELVLPEFQRGYIWTTEQVKNYTTENSYSRLILDGSSA
jgi:uncharacterized protein with ParB-like and HNH nuclease domain